jgi:hypothetical protein
LVGRPAGNHQAYKRGTNHDVDERRTPWPMLAELAELAGVDRFDLDFG